VLKACSWLASLKVLYETLNNLLKVSFVLFIINDSFEIFKDYRDQFGNIENFGRKYGTIERDNAFYWKL